MGGAGEWSKHAGEHLAASVMDGLLETLIVIVSYDVTAYVISPNTMLLMISS